MGILVLLLTAEARAAVGVTPASHGVSPGGNAMYSVPIRATPGIGPLTPALSVNWAGPGRRGILGVGFELAGLSQIHRCGRNIAGLAPSPWTVSGSGLKLLFAGTYSSRS
jgi:hypothetical protein